MSKKIIDIVLLPPENIMDICIKINSQDPHAFSNLNKKNNFPHISLAMGAIETKKLPAIKNIVKKIAESFKPISLKIIKTSHIITPANIKSYQLNFEKNNKITKLHISIMNNLKNLLTYDVQPDMFYKNTSEEIDEVSMHWVKTYKSKASNPNNFNPHISLKCTKADYKNFPVKFNASQLAICHMGKHGTCRKLLSSTLLT